MPNDALIHCNNALKLGIPNSRYFQRECASKHTAFITKLILLYFVNGIHHYNHRTPIRLQIYDILGMDTSKKENS